MSNYLHNIVARSLNAVEVIQPRLPLLFEPVAADIPSLPVTSRPETVSTDEDELKAKVPSQSPSALTLAVGQIAPIVSKTPAVNAVERAPQSQSREAGPTQVLNSIPPQMDNAADKQPVKENEQVNVVTAKPRNDSVTEKRSQERFGIADQQYGPGFSATTGISTRRPSEHFHQVKLDMQVAERSSPGVSTTSESSGFSSLSLRSNDLRRQESEPPAVKITIGRIEVRALMPTPTQASPPPVRPKPGLSLNDYLKQREEGKR
jgi:hypothetical protein